MSRLEVIARPPEAACPGLRVCVPITTSVLVSLALSGLLWLLSKLR